MGRREGGRAISWRAGPAALLSVALLAGVVGAVMAVAGAVNRPRLVASSGRAGDLTLEVSRAEWVTHDMEPMPGMAVAGMAPEGFTRLHLEVTLQNRGGGRRTFATEQFGLEAERARVDLASTSFVTGAIGPGELMAGDLFFDVPTGATDHALRLAWRVPGRDVLFQLDAPPGPAPHGQETSGHEEATR